MVPLGEKAYYYGGMAFASFSNARQELLAYRRIRSDICGPVYLLPFHRIRLTFDIDITLKFYCNKKCPLAAPKYDPYIYFPYC